MATQIARIGKTIAVEIPEDLLRRANLAVGDPVEWSLTPTGELALQSSHAEPAEADYEAWAYAEIAAGLADAEAGRIIPHEKVAEWLQSWGKENELPPPQ